MIFLQTKYELNYIKSEFEREMILLRRYFINTLADFALFVFFIGVIFMGARTVKLSSLEASIKVINFTVYIISIYGLQQLVNMVREENELGTMQQLFLLPPGFLKIFFIRSIVHIIQQIIILSLVTAVFITVTGVGFLFGGIAFVFKRVNQAVSLVTLLLFPVYLLNFTGGTPFQGAINYFPFTLGLKVVQTVIYESWSWKQLIQSSQFLLLIFISLVYFSVGLMIYTYFIKKSKYIGAIGKY